MRFLLFLWAPFWLLVLFTRGAFIERAPNPDAGFIAIAILLWFGVNMLVTAAYVLARVVRRARRDAPG